MSGPRVGTCPGCGLEVSVRADGKFGRHNAARRHSERSLGDCPWSYKPAPETRPAQLELEAGER